jgi:hypothetical protein
MELLLGSAVRERGHRAGWLAGFELEPDDLRIRRIILSPDGELGPQATMRPLAAVASVHDDGDVELKAEADIAPMTAVRDVTLLSRATRLRRGSRLVGRLTGIAVNPADRRMVSVFGRPHWWSRRFTFAAAELDCSTPGEIRSGPPSGTRAA